MALISRIQRPVGSDLLDVSKTTKPASERDFQLWTESMVPQRRLGPSDCPGGRRSTQTGSWVVHPPCAHPFFGSEATRATSDLSSPKGRGS